MNERSPRRVRTVDTEPEKRQANHAEYSGLVLFRSTFEGELPAVEYPKINVSHHDRSNNHGRDVKLMDVVLPRTECYLLQFWLFLGVSMLQASF